ncbi:SDR family oxidoreductase [Streptomyces sp. YIM S03343]
MTDLTGKTALITGSARGLGRAIALRYASLGADIVVNYSSDKDSAKATAAEIERLGRQSLTVRADVSSVADIERLFDEATARFGKIDIAVANAGVEQIGIDFVDITEEQFDRLFSINTKGAFFTLRAAARRVADNGRIIYVGSSSTAVPFAREGLYGSSKAAPCYAVGVLAQELADRGVTANTILPTAVEAAGVFTDFDPDHPIRQFVARPGRIGRRMGTVDDVADAAEYFASDLAAWVSGQTLLVTGGTIQ